MKFCEKLIQLRKQKGYSQENLAERLGVSRQAVSRWENGETTPDMSVLIKICEVYNISADYLIRDDYEKEEDIPVIQQKNKEIIEVRKKNSKLLLISAIMFIVVSFCALMSLITAQSDMQIIVDAIWLGVSIGATCFRFKLYFKEKEREELKKRTCVE